jgi:phosphoribosyl-ATP pyrophosphohydrolase
LLAPFNDLHFRQQTTFWEGSRPVPKSQRTLDKLERTIADRAVNPREKSYTSQLLAGGARQIGAKVIEEAAEVAAAAGEEGDAGRTHFVNEAADLVYHLLVLLRQRDCSLADVEAELARRFGVSGIEEKASRRKKTVAATKSAAKKKSPTGAGRRKSVRRS